MTQTVKQMKFKVRVPIKLFRRSEHHDRIGRIAQIAGTGLGGINYQCVSTRMPRSISIELVASGHYSAIDLFIRQLREAYPDCEIT